ARAGRASLRSRPGLDLSSRPRGCPLRAQLRAGHLAAAADHARRAASSAAASRAAAARDHPARARRLRGVVRVSLAKAGERLPYLLSKLKAPRVLERLEQTAERARAEQWPYEQFLESLLEAEVFARDASGARMRIRHAAFPALKTLEDFDWKAEPSARGPARPPPRPAGLDRGTCQRLLLRPARDRQDAPGDRARAEGLRARLPSRLRD